jgi:hypothetical protein
MIAPQGCKIFEGEALSYFFYGRPAFRPNADAEPSGLSHYFPICLIFKRSFALAIARVFPFDSGAFQNGLYASYIHRKMCLGDFGLEAESSTPGRVISRFFGTVPAYLKGNPSPTDAIDPSEFEAQSYLALIHSKEGNAIDSRGASIEVQTSEHVSITDAVAAVVLPSNFADGATGARLVDLKVDILPYRTFERSRPGEYTSTISSLCLDYYMRAKIIKETI